MSKINTTHNENEYINANDMIFSNDENIPSAGFSVNSIIMKAGLSPIMTINNDQMGGYSKEDGNSNLFDNLVVPNWTWSLNNNEHIENTIGGKYKQIKNDNNNDIINDELYDRLLDLAKENIETNKNKKDNKRKTKRQIKNKNNSSN